MIRNSSYWTRLRYILQTACSCICRKSLTQNSCRILLLVWIKLARAWKTPWRVLCHYCWIQTFSEYYRCILSLGSFYVKGFITYHIWTTGFETTLKFPFAQIMVLRMLNLLNSKLQDMISQFWTICLTGNLLFLRRRQLSYRPLS